MRNYLRKLYFSCIAILLAFLPHTIFASPYYGAQFSYAAMAKEPEFLRGYQVLVNYDPQTLQWRKFNLYFDAGYSRLWVTNPAQHSALNIYSISPVIRYEFKKRGPFVPYLELSIGFSWLSNTRFDDRNFGIHFAFQDRFGFGAYVGSKQQLSLGIHVVHYSNAHLSAYNSGITIPLMLDIGYRFSLC